MDAVLRARISEVYSSAKGHVMPDNLMDIEGIGQGNARSLENAGLKTTDDLLKSAGAAAGRKSLAEKTGINESRILEWVNRADLMRIKGVGSEYADLLEATGVDSVKELAGRVAPNLQTRMAQINEEKKLVHRVPNNSEVEAWVSEAKTMPAMVSH
jgi:predicted flap endonuclease-1-like 5' DNA nuclease